MYFWKTVQTLDSLNERAYQELVNSCLGSDVHPERKKSFCLAREALRLSLLEAGIKLEISDLVLTNFHTLKQVPEITLSLSHTKGAGAALCAWRKDYLSLGMDMERLDREVRQDVRARIAHPQDEDLRNLEIWTLKEAVYKCLMNTDRFATPVLATDIQVGRNKWLHSPSGLSGDCELKPCQEYQLALAFLKT